MTEENLYEILGIPITASRVDIVKAYRLLARKYHPDRNPDGDEMFKAVSHAYSILSDPVKRRAFDSGNEYDGGGKLDANDVEEFVKFYKYSKDQAADIISHFKEFSGEITQIYDYVPCLEPTDDDFNYICNVITESIPESELGAFKSSSKKLKGKLKKLARKALADKENFISTYGDVSFSDLVTSIRSNRQRRGAELLKIMETATKKSVKKRRGEAHGISYKYS